MVKKERDQIMISNKSNFIHDKNKQQFQLLLSSGKAFIDYEVRAGKMYLLHAEVPYHLRGQNIGKALVEKTFEYLEQQNIQAVAICTFIKLLAQRSEKWRNIIN